MIGIVSIIVGRMVEPSTLTIPAKRATTKNQIIKMTLPCITEWEEAI